MATTVLLQYQPGEKVLLDNGRVKATVVCVYVYQNMTTYSCTFWKEDNYMSAEFYDYELEKAT